MHAQGGHGSHAGGHRFNGHHGFRSGHSFRRQPFFAWGTGVDWMDPEEVVMIPRFVEPSISAVPAPDPAPAPDPKFVFPPTPNAPSSGGSHTVIVQRGSQIEVLSFPAIR
jgi:hypothetical protein